LFKFHRNKLDHVSLPLAASPATPSGSTKKKPQENKEKKTKTHKKLKNSLF